MSPLELTRYLLIGALLVVAYLIVLAWNEDYGSERLLEQPPTPAPLTPDNERQVSSSALSASANTQADEVPDFSDIHDPAPVMDATQAGKNSKPLSPVEQLIRISNDTLNLWVHPRGGDIVRVTLPGYPVSLSATDVPFTLLDQQPGFIYVAKSGLTGPDGIDGAPSGRPLYSASSREFHLQQGRSELVVPLGYTDAQGNTWTKRFTLRPGSYAVHVDYLVDKATDQTLRVSPYAQLKRSPGPPPLTSAPGMGPQPYVGAAFTTLEDRYLKVGFNDLDDGAWETRMTGGWLAILQHYFLSAWVPDSKAAHVYRGRRAADNTYLVEYISPLISLRPDWPADQPLASAVFYAGPKIQKRLESLASNLSLTVDYGFLWWISVPLFHFLEALHGMVDNWGIAIILLTLIVKLLLFPLSAASYKSMAHMRNLAPEMRRLQELHGSDRQKLSQEMMNLYKKEKVNPLGGCLPMLLQMPIFLALYWVLYESVELRHAPFVFWIKDLAAIDPYFVLPLLMGVTMYIQQLLSPMPPDPTQAKIMKLMPVIFTGLFLFFPSGLVLYWLVNNVISIAQQWYITRQLEHKVQGTA